MSRKFDPGYDEKREKEIAELIETMQVREAIEREIETRRAELETGYDDE